MTKFRLEKLSGAECLEIVALDGKVTLKLMLKEWSGICRPNKFAFEADKVKMVGCNKLLFGIRYTKLIE
jgi:hypothetical protein